MFLTPKRIKKSKGDNQRTAAHSGGGGGWRGEGAKNLLGGLPMV